MKLVDILARELKEWPEGADKMVQGFSGRIFTDKDQQLSFYPELAEDWSRSIVTRAQWQAAVDALKAGEPADPEVDWSKAPEDATHFSPAYESFIELWAKTDGNRWMYRSMDATKWHYGPPPDQDEYYVERPLRTVDSMALHHQEVGRITRVWDGEGLAPIGMQVSSADHGVLVVLAHGIFRGQDLVICQGDDTIVTCTPDQLSPVRTAEQIAAEERDKEIKDLYYTINWGEKPETWSHLSNQRKDDYAKAIDAGYRKQVRP